MSYNIYTQDYSFLNEDQSLLAIDDENRLFEVIDESVNKEIETKLNSMQQEERYISLMPEEKKQAEEIATYE